ncbi:hypothetical protein [Paraburkholderia sp. BCC1885]|uniref:hypothetical protein n=1 Tax=Paraburkholderia sp. BCC1885 TaxID=2562669 RepID=UPI001183EA34|nr:hypothetical protein [Paraburkholderia sp. BCC1885]
MTKKITVSKPVVDRIAYVLPLPNREYVINPMIQRLERLIASLEGRVEIRGGRHYQSSFRINTSGGSCFVQLLSKSPRAKGGLRVELNPARFSASDIEYFHKILGKVVGTDYEHLNSRPIINRIDFAVDVHNVEMEHLLVTYQNNRRLTMFGKRSDRMQSIESMYFGSVDSGYRAVVYDKRIERVHASAVVLAKTDPKTCTEALVNNRISRLMDAFTEKPYIRIEVRCQINGKSPLELSELPNRFARFTICDIGSDEYELEDWLYEGFVAICQSKGVKAALATYDDSPHKKTVRTFWESARVDWWQPKDMWQEGCQALQNCGLFPESVFSATS